MTTINITLDKLNNLYIDNYLPSSLSAKDLAIKLTYYKEVAIIPATWTVVENAPVSIEQQNKTYLRRLESIAKVCGRQIEMFDRLDDVKFGCVLTAI